MSSPLVPHTAGKFLLYLVQDGIGILEHRGRCFQEKICVYAGAGVNNYLRLGESNVRPRWVGLIKKVVKVLSIHGVDINCDCIKIPGIGLRPSLSCVGHGGNDYKRMLQHFIESLGPAGNYEGLILVRLLAFSVDSLGNAVVDVLELRRSLGIPCILGPPGIGLAPLFFEGQAAIILFPAEQEVQEHKGINLTEQRALSQILILSVVQGKLPSYLRIHPWVYIHIIIRREVVYLLTLPHRRRDYLRTIPHIIRHIPHISTDRHIHIFTHIPIQKEYTTLSFERGVVASLLRLLRGALYYQYSFSPYFIRHCRIIWKCVNNYVIL